MVLQHDCRACNVVSAEIAPGVYVYTHVHMVYIKVMAMYLEQCYMSCKVCTEEMLLLFA